MADLGLLGDQSDPTTNEDLVHASSLDSQHGSQVLGHSDYLSDGSTSQYNVAAIATGNGDQIVRGNTVEWRHGRAYPEGPGESRVLPQPPAPPGPSADVSPRE